MVCELGYLESSCLMLLQNGEYGVDGYYVGVPVIIGQHGVERIVEVPLSAEEQTAFNKSVDTVKELVHAVQKLA